MKWFGRTVSMLKRWLTDVIDREQFRPRLIGILVNPFYIARKGLYEHISALGGQVRGNTLDVGCGRKPYETLFRSSRYVGLEIDTPDNRRCKKADVFYDGGAFPFGEAEFDSVVTNEVFEHVFDPDRFFGEIRRVLKPGGTLLMTVPFVWDEHEQPHDYARYSSFALEAIAKRHGFEILELRKSVNDIRVVFQLLNGYIYKKTVGSNHVVNLLAVVLLMAPFNVIGEILAKILPKNDDLYLDTVVLARKTGP